MSGKSKSFKMLSTAVVALIFVLLLIGTSPPPPQVNKYFVGDTIRWNGLDVNVLGMERASEYKNLKLKPDYEFILVTVEFKNVSFSAQSFPDGSETFFLIEDGITYSPEDVAVDKKDPNLNGVAKGEKATGTYVYMIPKGQTGLVLSVKTTKNGGLIESRVFLDE